MENDPLQILYSELLKEEHVETIHDRLPKEVTSAINDFKSLNYHSDNFQRDLRIKIDRLTKILARHIPPTTKQPVQIYHKGVRIK